jgi:hypothetical protein
VSASIITYADHAIPTDVQTAVYRQWASRPADQRFAELDLLQASVDARRRASVVEDVDVRTVTANTNLDGDRLSVVSPALGPMTFTHWSFGQFASLVGAPAAYLRKLPAPLAVQCLNHGIEVRGADGMKLYAVDQDAGCELRATTSQTYGRIFDADVVQACRAIVDASNGTWFSPWAWGKQHRALFASDRDIFCFFIDGGSIVDGGGERDQMHRGWFVKNSEVGAATFELTTFLFRVCCGNFNIFDMKDAKSLRIRHTSGGPERFVSEAIPQLQAYAQGVAGPVELTIRAAKAYALPAKDEDLYALTAKFAFTQAETRRAKQQAEIEEGQCATLWDLHNGFTAYARMLAYADAQVDLVERAGKFMRLVQ